MSHPTSDERYAAAAEHPTRTLTVPANTAAIITLPLSIDALQAVTDALTVAYGDDLYVDTDPSPPDLLIVVRGTTDG